MNTSFLSPAPYHHGSNSDRGWASGDANHQQPPAGASDADEHGPGDTGGERTTDHGSHSAPKQPNTSHTERSRPTADTSGASLQFTNCTRSGAGAAPTSANCTNRRRTDIYLSTCCH